LFADLKSVSGILEGLRNDPAHIRARAKGGLDTLVARPEVDSSRIAAIGYCFGGTMALELARGSAQIVGVVGFHSGLGTVAPQDAARNIKGKVLVCIGADDPVIPLEQRIDFEKEMRNGGVDWQMNVYGGVVHSFTNPDADKAGRTEVSRYDAKAAARSWAAMRVFGRNICLTARNFNGTARRWAFRGASQGVTSFTAYQPRHADRSARRLQRPAFPQSFGSRLGQNRCASA
jgi:dienelactone hydrolase